MDKVGKVSTIIQNHVGERTIGEDEGGFEAPHILLISLSLPGINGDTRSCEGGGSLVLGGENVARAPGDLSTEGDEGLDENGSLDGSVEGSSNAGTLQGLSRAISLAKLHKTRHLNFSQFDFLATPSS